MNEAPDWVNYLPAVVGGLFLLGSVAIVAVCLVVASRWKKSAEANITRLAESLGGKARFSALNALPMSTGRAGIQGRHQDVPYQVSYFGGGRHSGRARIRVVIPVRPHFTLSLRKENFDTKLSKKIGMARELETGIPDFDAEYFIQTNDPTSCRSFLTVDAHRDAIRRIHQAGYALTFSRKQIVLGKGVTPQFSPDRDIVDPDELKGVLDAVVTLARGL